MDKSQETAYCVCNDRCKLKAAPRWAFEAECATVVLKVAPRLMLSVLFAITAAACVRTDVPVNNGAKLYSPEKSAKASRASRGTLTFADNRCAPAGTAKFMVSSSKRKSKRHRMPAMRYSSGDRFSLMIMDSPDFSGDYAVNVDGTIILPYVGGIKAVGLTNNQLTRKIRRTLTRRGLFTAEAGQISVQPVQYAPVNVTVAGAVFNPGRHTINITKAKEKLDQRRTKSGDSPLDRFVPAALLAAGGVRPDADISKIVVKRRGKRYKLDWRGAITGRPVDDMPLIEGDHVEVPESNCFQSALVRPSQLTPHGIRVYLSNLTVPGQSSVTINPATAGGLPYGTRFLQGLVHANCVGGTYSTNAKRYAVLISRNPKTHKTEVIQRSVEDLVRRGDRDSLNPYLMPDDAIACYDSSVSEFRDVMATISGALTPASLVK